MSDKRPLTLLERLNKWCQRECRGPVFLSVCREPGPDFGRPVATNGRGMIAYGDSTNQAINNLADALAEEGWPDDRPDAARQPDRRRCDRCGHAAERHSTDVPELRVFLCQVEGCPCAGWLYRQPEGEQ